MGVQFVPFLESKKEIPDDEENSMKNLLKLCSLASLLAVTLALFPSTLRAQWVYVNDNVPAPPGRNTVAGFKNAANALVPTAPPAWATLGTSALNTDATKDQALFSTPSLVCLYVADPLKSPGRPHGDIAGFKVNPVNGKLTWKGRFVYPFPANDGTTYGIALTVRQGNPTLYAGFSKSNTIVSYKINPINCHLTYEHGLAVSPLHGGSIGGMAESPDGTTLVVSFNDGSIETLETPANYAIHALPCPVAINSTGWGDGNHGFPYGVDITKDSLYAIFGDRSGGNGTHGPTELEVLPLPINAACTTVTTDFGGSIPGCASGTCLGTYIDSTNVWLSPDESVIYVTNNGPQPPQGITTVTYAEPFGLALAAGCAPGFTNPTSLIPPNTGFFEPNGIQTYATTGKGKEVYVAEYVSVPPPKAAVALLDVDAVGCTQEVAGSPFPNPHGNHGGADQISAFPRRPF
jgi:hypothetical protein